MKLRLAILIALLSLAFPGLALANMGVHVFDSDDDYHQIVFQQGAITFCLSMATLLGFVLVVRNPGTPRIVGIVLVLIFGVSLLLYFRSIADVRWWTGPRPPGTGRIDILVITSIGHPPTQQFQFRYPPAQVGMILAFVITVAGLLLSFCIRARPAKSAPQADAKTEANAVPEAAQQPS